MKKLLIIAFLFGGIYAQDLIQPVPATNVTWANYNVADDSIRVSEAELFLQDISDKAIAKDEKRKEFKMDMLTIAVVYLIIDKLFIK